MAKKSYSGISAIFSSIECASTLVGVAAEYGKATSLAVQDLLPEVEKQTKQGLSNIVRTGGYFNRQWARMLDNMEAEERENASEASVKQLPYSK